MNLYPLTAPEIYRSGIDRINRTSFGLEVTQKAYKILSSTIYKYKIRAIVRELSTNAIDGHMMVGNMNPFDVHIPSVMEPHFYVRDYGVGMSDDEIHYHASVYFKSGKEEIENSIGVMGLGFKSPFCYSETFTIISWYKGVKRTYVAYFENGNPFVDAIEEIASDEPTGIQIIVPVKQEDIKEWEKEASRVYQSFTTIRPNFIGVEPVVKYQPTEPTGDNDLIVHKTAYYHGLYARMGNIMYPIDRDLFEDTLLACYVPVNDGNTYILDFKLGELDFMPSREELSMDKVTKANLLKRIDKLNAEYHEKLLAEYKKCKTIRHKLVFHANHNKVSSHIEKNQDFFIKGKSIKHYLLDYEPRTNKLMGLFNGLYGFWANSHGGAGRCKFEIIGRHGYKRNEAQSRLNVSKIMNPMQQINMYLIDMDVVIYRPALVGYCLKNKINNAMFINDRNNSDTIAKLIEYCSYEKDNIIRLKASEMIAEVDAYNKAFPKTSRPKKESTESRPKTPTAIRYTLTGDVVEKEDLFLTKSQFLDLPAGFGLKIFGNEEIMPLEGESNLQLDNLILRYRLDMMRKTEIKSVILIRNSLWKYIPESKITCLEKELIRIVKNASKKLKPDNYSCVPRGIDMVHTLQSVYGVTLDRFVKNRYDEKNYKIVDFLTGFISQYTKDKTLTDIVDVHMKNSSLMNKRVLEAVAKFEELNPLLSGILHAISYNGRVSYMLKMQRGKAKSDFQKMIRWK